MRVRVRRFLAVPTPQLLLSSACAIVLTMKASPTAVFPHMGLAPHQFTPMSGAHKPDVPNPAIASRLHGGHHRRGVGTFGHGTLSDMSTTFCQRIRDWRLIVALAVGVAAGYVATVGIVPATFRHTGVPSRWPWRQDCCFPVAGARVTGLTSRDGRR